MGVARDVRAEMTVRGLRVLRRRRRGDDGAAAVEFAFIAPILIFLLLAIVGYGYMLSFRQAMSQAASEGARAAAVAPPGLPQTAIRHQDSVRKRAVDAVNQGLAGYGVTCVPPNSPTATNGTLMWAGRNAGDCVITFNASCSASTTVSKCAKVALSLQLQGQLAAAQLPWARHRAARSSSPTPPRSRSADDHPPGWYRPGSTPAPAPRA